MPVLALRQKLHLKERRKHFFFSLNIACKVRAWNYREVCNICCPEKDGPLGRVQAKQSEVHDKLWRSDELIFACASAIHYKTISNPNVSTLIFDVCACMLGHVFHLNKSAERFPSWRLWHFYVENGHLRSTVMGDYTFVCFVYCWTDNYHCRCLPKGCC